jgi:hypothetical protein
MCQGRTGETPPETKEKKMTETLTTTTVSVPSVMGHGPAEGTEHLTSDDVLTPRLKLAQAMSPQVNRSNPDYVEGLGSGDFFNDITGHIYGRGPLRVSIIVSHPLHAIEFAPMSEGGGIIERNVPLTDPRVEWVGGEQPQATKIYDYTAWLHETQELVVFSLMRSGYKMARQLNSLIRLRRNDKGFPAPVYQGLYFLTSASKPSKEGGTFEKWVFANQGNIDDADLPQFQALYAHFLTLVPASPEVEDL